MSEIVPMRTGFDEAQDALQRLSLEMSGGEDLDSYLDEFRAKGQSQCTNVWSKGVIAYRCRSCQINDSSAICVDCFQGGDHWKHDYVMYHSESGGCCDCGDRAAWKESGFCTSHQRLNLQEAVVKVELLGMTHRVVKYVLQELLAWVLKLTLTELQSSSERMAMIYLDWSQKVCAVDALRNIVCEDIICEYIPLQSKMTSPLNILLEYLARMPEKIIEAETTLFLQLLYNNEFKYHFLQLLKPKYEGMIISAVNDERYLKIYKELDTNLDRVMVQLFNDPDVTTELIHKYHLLDLFIGVFSKVVSSCTENMVVNVEKEAIKCKVYLRPQGDLRLIVAHGNIAVNMLREQPELFPRILDILVNLQWMNPYQIGEDIESENSWTLAIQLEMNSMAIIYQLVARCHQDPISGKETLFRAATYTLTALKQYLKQVENFCLEKVSLHIPLHRTLSAILQKLVLLPWENVKAGFLPDLGFNFSEKELLELMEHPLQILVWMAQIRAQMWRATSEEFSRLELIYRGSFWHDQSMDMDILLLQFCTVALDNMEEKIFIRIAERFDLEKMVTSPLLLEMPRQPKSKEIHILQDFMRLILLVVRERRNLGPSEDDDGQDKCLQYDVIQWLCVRDQTYSQLCRALSAIPMDHQRLTDMLTKVAIYHEPKVADRGYYQLKPEYWKEFDPLFAHYYLNELEEAEDRAVKVGKLGHYWRIKAPPPAGAPYNRLSNLLHTKACHLFLVNVLNEVRNLVKLDTTATAGEALGVTALQMLAVLFSDRRNKSRPAPGKPISSAELQNEFPTDDIFSNIHVKLHNIQSSIHEMLMQLQHAKNCTRLVDSVNHVLELLDLKMPEKSYAADVKSSRDDFDSLTAEESRRNLRKEQRQKAILEEFAAKREAFLEQQAVSDDDESPVDGSLMIDSGVIQGASGSVDLRASSDKLTKDAMDADCVSLFSADEAKECVLCRSKSALKSTCWIALVQQYNFSTLVLNRGKALENINANEFSSTFSQSDVQKLTKQGSMQLVTVISSSNPQDSTVSCIDYVPAEHVQCCGHQMHFDCFQGHIETLQSSHRGHSGYAGKGILDLNKVEFLCPICRRLANVILPDVDTSILFKKLQVNEDVEGRKETVTFWRRFWQSNKNLESAIDFCSTQILKVRAQSNHLEVATSCFINCKALWQGLALNIVHCEVTTRGHGKEEAASSSSTQSQGFDEHTWGGDSAHWLALRGLGQLAMLSNTMPDAAQEKSHMLEMLRQCLGLHARTEAMHTSDSYAKASLALDGDIELEMILQEMFPLNLSECLNSVEPVESTDLVVAFSSGKDELAQDGPKLIPLCDKFMKERTEMKKHLGKGKLGETHSSKQTHLVNIKSEVEQTCVPDELYVQMNDRIVNLDVFDPQGNCNIVSDKTAEVTITPGNMGDCGDSRQSLGPLMSGDRHAQQENEMVNLSKFNAVEVDESLDKTTAMTTAPVNMEKYLHVEKSLGAEEFNTFSRTKPMENQSNWTKDILKNGVLGADPFGLLIVLIITFTGQIEKQAMGSMVKFAYTVAVLQTQMAVAGSGVIDSEAERDLVQRACLPFLRRVALLVHIVSREDFEVQFQLPGTDMMNFLHLQQALQLPDCTEILCRRNHGAVGILATSLLKLHTPMSERSVPRLWRVPREVLLHVLPQVFQELLLENIHNKKTCQACKEMPPDPAICLLCGELLCCGSNCCKLNGVGECSRHAAEESAGVGVFLLLRSTQLLLLRNNRSCMGLSLYLDAHGEEDLYLRRSQLLYLSDLRLNEIQRLWRTAAFDYDSYILRNSQSRPYFY